MKKFSAESFSFQYNENKDSSQEIEDVFLHNENNYCKECSCIPQKFLSKSFISHSNCNLAEKEKRILIIKDNEPDQIKAPNLLHFGNNATNKKVHQYSEENGAQSLLKFNDYCSSPNLPKLEKKLKQKLINRELLERQINEKLKELKNIEDNTAKINRKYFKCSEIDQNFSRDLQNLSLELENKNCLKREKNDILRSLENTLSLKEEETKLLTLRIELANLRINEAVWMKEEKDMEFFLLSKLTPEYDNELQNLTKLEGFNSEEIKELKEAETGLKDVVNNLENDIKDQRIIVKELTSTINQLNIRTNKFQENLAKTKQKKAKIKSEIKEIKSNIERSQEFSATNESELRKLSLQARGTIKSLEDLNQEISAHYIMFSEIERSPINRKTILSLGKKSMISWA